MADVGNRGGRPSERDEPALIELVMLEPGPVPGTTLPAARPGAPRSPGPRTPRMRHRRVAFALVAAFVVVIVAVVRDDRRGAQQTAVPPSTLAPTTVVAAPTTLPATSIPATSIAPSIAPSSLASGPITTAPVSLGPGPVLGAARGWTLVSFDSVILKLLDLDSGKTDTTAYDITRFAGATESAIMLADRFVYTQHADGTPSVWSQRFLDEPQTMVLDDASIITSSSSPGRFWVALNQEGVNGEQLVAEVDATGRRWNTVAVPKGLRVVGSSAAGLWLTGSGRIFAISREGVVQHVAIGTVIDAASSGVLYDECGIAGPCTLRLATLGPVVTSSRVGPSADIRVARPNIRGDSALSPTGRWLLLADGAIDRRTSGPISHPFVLQSWRWSPDSEWLFAWTANSGTIAWNLSDGRKIPLGNFALSGLVAR